MMTRLFLRLVLSLLLVAAGLGVAQARQITDMTGRRVTVPEKITRAYATAPPATCMLLALAPDLLVGINTPLGPAAAKFVSPRVRQLPVVGGWFGQGRMPNLETLMQVKPDVVLGFQLRRAATSWKIEQTLEPLGLPVFYVSLETLSEYPAAFRLLGELLDRKERAAKLAAYFQETLDQAAALRAALPEAEKLSVYYAQGAQGLNTECDNSIHAELIPLCGGRNVHRCRTTTVYGMEKVSLEQVIAYNPQVILAHDPKFLAMVRSDPRWKDIRAVREGRIYRIPRIPFNWFDRPPSFMRVLGAQWLMHRLYPKRHQVDMTRETQKFFRLFCGVELDEAAARSLFAQ